MGEPVEIVVNGLLGQDRRGDQAHSQHNHRQHHGEQSLFHVAFFLSLILSLSPARRHFRRRRRKSEGTDAKSGSPTDADPLFPSARRMSQCRQASDPAVGVSDLSGSVSFTVTTRRAFCTLFRLPAAWGRPLDLLFSFSAGFVPVQDVSTFISIPQAFPHCKGRPWPPLQRVFYPAPRKSSLRRSLPPAQGPSFTFARILPGLLVHAVLAVGKAHAVPTGAS